MVKRLQGKLARARTPGLAGRLAGSRAVQAGEEAERLDSRRATAAETAVVREEDTKDPAEAAVEPVVATKEEDLELTTQVILNFINSKSDGDGVVDDDDDDEL